MSTLTEQSESKRFYDKFYLSRGYGSSGIHEPWYKQTYLYLRDILDTHSFLNILEVGSGTGEFLTFLSYKYQQHYFLGLEISKTATKKALSIKKGDNIDFILGDISSPPFKTNPFDIIVICEVIEHLVDPELALKNIEMISNKDSKLVVSFPNALNVPWYLTIWSSRRFNIPPWPWSKQVPDNLMHVNKVKKLIHNNTNFEFKSLVGTAFAPPLSLLYSSEKWNSFFSYLVPDVLSLHPVMFFSK